MGRLLELPGKTYSIFYGEFVAFFGGGAGRFHGTSQEIVMKNKVSM